VSFERRAIAISGRIGSGKSTLTKALASSFGWDAISFGRYVKFVADDRGLGTARQALQDLGQALIADAGEDRFLQVVLEFYRPTSPVQLFDGVRHAAMIDAIRRHYDATSVICLVLDDRTRYERYTARTAEPVDYHHFLAWDKHPVERDIARICEHADLRLNAALPISNLVDAAVETLRTGGLFPSDDLAV
jgi:dephospho-CoA kinase